MTPEKTSSNPSSNPSDPRFDAASEDVLSKLGSDSLTVMSYNLRVDLERDGQDKWPHRCDQVASVIRFHCPDVMGTQEGNRWMLGDIQNRVDGYEWVGTARDDGDGEHCAIFYRPDRVTLHDSGTFWLSETPDSPASRSWDAAYPRVVTWARLSVNGRPDAPWTVFNTHFDHEGAMARVESAHLLAHRTDPARTGVADRTLVLGDLNSTPDTEVYHILAGTEHLHDAIHRTTTPHHGPVETFNGFAQEVRRRIDYVFVTDDVHVRRHATLTDRWHGRYPSDHCPVFVEVDAQ